MSRSPQGSIPRRGLGALAFLFAVVCGPAPDARGADLRFSRLTRDDGLSQSTVLAITQDPRGFLWVGTQDGLNRFDGYGFKVYRRQPGGLPGNSIEALAVDRNGNLWIGSDQGLSRLDLRRESFESYLARTRDRNGLANGRVRALFEDPAGVLWIGTGGGGLHRLDPASGELAVYRHDPDDPSSLSHDNVTAILGAPEGGLWIATEGGGLNRLDPETGLFSTYRHRPDDPASLSHDRVACLYYDRSGSLWLCTDDGLDRLGSDGRFVHHRPGDGSGLSHREVRAVFQDRSGVLWVGTKSGLSRLPPGAEVFEVSRHRPADPSSLSDGFVRAIFEDASGLLWVGTDGRGLNAFDPTKAGFVSYRHSPGDPNSLAGNMIWSLYEDRRGVLWVGTWGKGLNRYDDAAGSFTRFANRSREVDPLAANIVHDIHEDRGGVLWLATDQGLYRFDRPTGRYTAFRRRPGHPIDLGRTIVRSVREDRHGALWIGTEQGLCRLDRRRESVSELRHDPLDDTSLSNDVALVIYEDRGGDLWIGTEDGLNLLDPAGRGFRRYLTPPAPTDSVTSAWIRSVHEDRLGNLWVGTDDGLHLLDRASGTSTVYREEQGLPNSVIYGILEDSGFLWLSTNNGLSRFDPADGTIRNYDKSDGLQDNEFNRGAYLRRANGQLLFGGINGLTAFLPSAIRDNTFVPPVVLTSFKRYNQEVRLDRPITEVRDLTLPHDSDVLSFEFAALDFHAPEKNLFAYKLEGLNPGWIHLGTKHELTFVSLKPGSYVFHLRASNNDGRWNEAGLAVGLEILPPFWGTTYFRVLAAALVLLVLAAAYQLRTRRMRRHNLALLAEVAERRRAEDAQRELNAALEAKQREFEAQQKELELKNAELERYAYTVSHDLRSPLVTIRGYLDLLRRAFAAPDAAAFERHAEVISAATHKMSRLLEELLQLSRVGRVVNPPQPVPLSDLAHEVVDLLAGRLAERGIEVDIQPEMPTVRADRVRLLEVFQNLLENAAKFMGAQPEPRIEIGGMRRSGELLAFVRDNGIGIPEPYRERVFGLFQRLDKTVDGTGVGLALVRRIVEVHGGRVWVESEGENRGSTFWMAFRESAAAGTEAP